MGRVLALDVGDVRIGVAVSDEGRIIAQPLEVYTRVGFGPDSRYVQALCQRYEADQVLLGLPLNMDGSAGGQAQKVRAFGDVLQKAGLPVCYQDERMTTVTAERVLLDGNVSRENRKHHVDKLAAAVILEQWLASRRETAERRQTMEDNSNLVQLQDENGKDVNFEHLMTIEHEGGYYVLLEATEDMDDCKEGEAIILKIIKDEHEDAYYIIRYSF